MFENKRTTKNNILFTWHFFHHHHHLLQAHLGCAHIACCNEKHVENVQCMQPKQTVSHGFVVCAVFVLFRFICHHLISCFFRPCSICFFVFSYIIYWWLDCLLLLWLQLPHFHDCLWESTRFVFVAENRRVFLFRPVVFVFASISVSSLSLVVFGLFLWISISIQDVMFSFAVIQIRTRILWMTYASNLWTCRDELHFVAN